jgi:ATP adenylyltransferase
MDTIHAPWRMDYLRSLDKLPQTPDACFICLACKCSTDEQRKSRLVLWDTEHSIVLMNRFPYTNGHLLVAPKRHVDDIEQLSGDELTDLELQTVRCVKLLKHVCSPQGFNIGMNLGRSAGAGLPGHIHKHIVPRWHGDVNFMTVVGEVRVAPQALSQLYEELLRAMPDCP